MFTRLILVIAVIVAMAIPCSAVDLGSKLKLDVTAKAGYAVMDADSQTVSDSHTTIDVDVDTRIRASGEVGLTIVDMTRVYLAGSVTEDTGDSFTVGAEFFPVQDVPLGVFAEYTEDTTDVDDVRIREQGGYVGVVLRVR